MGTREGYPYLADLVGETLVGATFTVAPIYRVRGSLLWGTREG